MNSNQAKELLIQAMNDYREQRVNYRYTRKHPLKGKEILQQLRLTQK